MADEVMKYSTAKAVATRKNNEIKKRFPLFADQVEEVTPEEVIARKAKYLVWSKKRRQEQLEQEVIEAAKLRQELRELIDDDTEFSLLDAEVVERQDRFGGIATSYRCMVKNMKKRLEPCSPLALRLLFYLEHNKHRDYSAYELGKLFNTDHRLISQELENLYDCALADTPNGIKTCTLTGKKCCHWMSTY
ncbi:MAG: hypothetical protein WAQ98_05195 [Blastocatellia bacterium]